MIVESRNSVVSLNTCTYSLDQHHNEGDSLLALCAVLRG